MAVPTPAYVCIVLISWQNGITLSFRHMIKYVICKLFATAEEYLLFFP